MDEQEQDVFANSMEVQDAVPDEQEQDVFTNTMEIQDAVLEESELFYLDAVQFDALPDKDGTEPFFMNANEYE
jgi:hypothetical protein